jgi:SAM-dependent methyltransferase
MKRYDRAYFDKWYRDPRHRVSTPAALARKVTMVVAIAEYQLARPIRSVLDVGCGEAGWRRVLGRLRPGATYLGVDASAYVVARYGRSRNIRLGTFGALDALGLTRPFDLIVCADVLQYVPTADLARGLAQLRALLGGVAYVEAYTVDDELEGDRRAWHDRSAGHYRRLFRQAGLTPLGHHCYVAPPLAFNTTALERAES